jgi:hypothetical protein
MFASHFYESFGKFDNAYKLTGMHVLNVPLWNWVLKLVQTWKQKHSGSRIHIGTPLYFLAVGYFLTHNNDSAFIYLIKSIGDDIELSEHCPQFHYPEREPAYMTVCLINHPNNYMYDFIIVPQKSVARSN